MSTQMFLLLLVVVGAGAHLLARALPLPPGSVPMRDADDDTEVMSQADALDQQDDESRRRRLANLTVDDDDERFNADVNIDGTPMIDGIDANGNTFGVTDDWLSSPFD